MPPDQIPPPPTSEVLLDGGGRLRVRNPLGPAPALPYVLIEV